MTGTLNIKQKKTKYEIKNKKEQRLLSVHEYVIERYMDRYFNRKNTA